jgi:hypothetical protein
LDALVGGVALMLAGVVVLTGGLFEL